MFWDHTGLSPDSQPTGPGPRAVPAHTDLITSLAGLNSAVFQTPSEEQRAFHWIVCGPRLELESFLEFGFWQLL